MRRYGQADACLALKPASLRRRGACAPQQRCPGTPMSLSFVAFSLSTYSQSSCQLSARDQGDLPRAGHGPPPARGGTEADASPRVDDHQFSGALALAAGLALRLVGARIRPEGSTATARQAGDGPDSTLAGKDPAQEEQHRDPGADREEERREERRRQNEAVGVRVESHAAEEGSRRPPPAVLPHDRRVSPAPNPPDVGN